MKFFISVIILILFTIFKINSQPIIKEEISEYFEIQKTIDSLMQNRMSRVEYYIDSRLFYTDTNIKEKEWLLKSLINLKLAYEYPETTVPQDSALLLLELGEWEWIPIKVENNYLKNKNLSDEIDAVIIFHNIPSLENTNTPIEIYLGIIFLYKENQ